MIENLTLQYQRNHNPPDGDDDFDTNASPLSGGLVALLKDSGANDGQACGILDDDMLAVLSLIESGFRQACLEDPLSGARNSLAAT
jgi:hypothetical protein